MRTRFLRFLGLCLTIGLVTPLLAQRPMGGGGGNLTGTALLAQKSVQEELKLTEDQVTKTKKIGEDIRTKYGEEMKAAFKDREKFAELRKKMNEESTKLLADVLKPEQVKRMHQIEVQLGGIDALSREDVAKELKLTEKQKEDLKARRDDLNKDRGDMFKDAGKDQAKQKEVREKIRTLTTEATTKFVNSLSDDQKKLYTELVGKKFEGKIEFQGTRPGGNKGDKEE